MGWEHGFEPGSLGDKARRAHSLMKGLRRPGAHGVLVVLRTSDAEQLTQKDVLGSDLAVPADRHVAWDSGVLQAVLTPETYTDPRARNCLSFNPV